MVPNLQESVSVDEDGIITITLNNLSISESEEIEISFTECKPNQVTAKILVNKMNAYNTFEQPEQVKQEDFAAFTVTEKGINFTIPACSIIQLRVK
ncbi:MAG: alpha-N-arabinofuranosidase, partial [Lachnospiraceae bacterium]|nr:alpha-N-arabinofuranosidase [Lachnospiraceae bacterium]